MVPQDNPTRRTVAKGAAWLVPTVSVAAAAPTLAASPLSDCTSGSPEVTIDGCSNYLVEGTVPSFRVTNPPGSGCEIPVGTIITITLSNNASFIAYEMEADLDFLLTFGSVTHVGQTVEITVSLNQPLHPGGSVVVGPYVAWVLRSLPEDWSEGATATLDVLGSSASFTWEADGLRENVYLACR